MIFLSDKQIQAQVSAIRRTLKSGPQHFAIRSNGAWAGSDRLLIDDVEHLVLPCISDLQVREALLEAETANAPAVLLCTMGDEALGEDVINRLAKRRVFSPQVREMVAELFSVSPTRIDPRVLKSKVLMNSLLDRVPAEGYPPVASGTLDVQTAWLTLLGRVIGETVETPSLTKLLEWSLSGDKLRSLAEMDTHLKAAFIDWFVRSKGESMRYMMAAIDSGFGADLVPLGAALGLVFDPKHHRNAEHQTARGRLERYFQDREIDAESARAWFRASDAILSQMRDESENLMRRALLNRLDEATLEGSAPGDGIQQAGRGLTFEEVRMLRKLMPLVPEPFGPAPIPPQAPENCEHAPQCKSGKPWDDKEEVFLFGLYILKYSRDKIAVRLGRSSGAVAARLKKMGIRARWES